MKTNAHMELDMKDFFAIYDTLLAGTDTEETLSLIHISEPTRP